MINVLMPPSPIYMHGLSSTTRAHILLGLSRARHFKLLADITQALTEIEYATLDGARLLCSLVSSSSHRSDHRNCDAARCLLCPDDYPTLDLVVGREKGGAGKSGRRTQQRRS